MAGSIVALLTDFGSRDPYVGMMKGVILGINPMLNLVDITHEIAPQHVREAAIVLSASYRYFPPGTLFLVVVDPGVGSARRALVAEVPQYTFIAPDNGVLGPVIEEVEDCRVLQVTNDAYFRPHVSRTFHGRDIFAPIAAWLSRGVHADRMGHQITDYARLPLSQPQVLADGSLAGEVIYEDRFGNLLTSLSESFMQRQWGPGPWEAMTARIERHGIRGLSSFYGEAPPGAVGMIIDSWGLLEIFVNQGHAGHVLGVGKGARVQLWRAGCPDSRA